MPATALRMSCDSVAPDDGRGGLDLVRLGLDEDDELVRVLRVDAEVEPLQEQEVRVDGKAHMLQLTDGQARIILDGYKTQYNYKKQLGHMQDAKGKMGHHYIRAQRIELFPKEIVLLSSFQSSVI